MAEFGSKRKNAGSSLLGSLYNRLDPTLSSFRACFPESKIVLYTDFDAEYEGVNVIQVENPFDSTHERSGWRACDYFQVMGMLQSNEICVAMDSDMLIYDKHAFRSLYHLTEKFGCCLPANSRDLVKIDGDIGLDSNYKIGEDASGGNGYVTNVSPMSFDPKNNRARKFYETYLELFKENPSRGTILLWRASWKTGINPYLLPLQWCVCANDVIGKTRKVAVQNPICLHLGHDAVKKHFGFNK